MSFNQVTILGRLGQDAEIKYTPAGAPVCNFSVATSEKYKTKSGELKENTEWHRVVVWGNQAEPCGMYLKKGSQVFLTGKIKTRSWEDKEGSKRYATEVIANNVQFLGGIEKNQETSAQENSEVPSFTSEDIPF